MAFEGDFGPLRGHLGSILAYEGNFGVNLESFLRSKRRQKVGPFFRTVFAGLGRDFERLLGGFGSFWGWWGSPMCCKKQYKLKILDIVPFPSDSSLGGLREAIRGSFWGDLGPQNGSKSGSKSGLKLGPKKYPKRAHFWAPHIVLNIKWARTRARASVKEKAS